MTRNTAPSGELVRQVRARDGGRCMRCGAPGTNTQHRIGRGMGGTRRIHTLAALVTLCGSGTTGCHGHITEHPTEAYATGWAIRRSDPRRASQVPLTDLYGNTFHLTDHGTIDREDHQ